MTTNKNKTILSLLKESTQTDHDTTEAVALSNKIVAGTLHLAAYQKLLVCNRNIHQSLSTSFSNFLESNPLVPIQYFVDHKRVQWLEADLKELNISLEKSNFLQERVPEYSTLPAIIGGLYVVEGSMLGGQFICRKLRENKHLKDISRFHFYNGYGPETGKRWATFRQLALQIVNTPAAIEACILAAKSTFNFFESSYRIGLSDID